MDTVRGDAGEAFRSVLQRAFRQAGITEEELARRLGLTTREGAHQLLKRKGQDGRLASIREEQLQAAARELGYVPRLELVPIETSPPPKPIETSPKSPARRGRRRA